MGKIINKSGNLLNSQAEIWCHGCNQKGKMGSGFAAQIAKLFPDVKKAYQDKYKQEGLTLGEIQVVSPKSGPPSLQYVVNMITQENYGRDEGTCYVSYPAIEQALTTLLEFAEDSKMTVAMPMIGAGLGGGNWNRILRIIRDVVSKYDVVVEIWKYQPS